MQRKPMQNALPRRSSYRKEMDQCHFQNAVLQCQLSLLNNTSKELKNLLSASWDGAVALSCVQVLHPCPVARRAAGLKIAGLIIFQMVSFSGLQCDTGHWIPSQLSRPKAEQAKHPQPSVTGEMRCSKPLIIFVLHWTQSRSSTPLLYWRAQN